MEDNEQQGFLDSVVEFVAKTMDSLGLNGTRLRWKWKRKKIQLSEAGARTEVSLRSARGKHKMCPGCRALVPKSSKECPECGRELGSVSAPGPGRFLANILPGATAATSLLLLVNGFWFILMIMAQIKGGGSGGGMLSLLGSFDRQILLRFGAGVGAFVLYDGEWWRIVAPIFLHGGLLHFGFNSYVLLQLGPSVEELYGTEKFWVIYLFAGITGNLAAELLRPLTTVVGASGAIVGLIGLMLAYGIRRGGALGQSIKSQMLRWAFYILIFSLLPGISLLAHAGGFAGGLALGMLIPAGRTRSRLQTRLYRVLALAGVALVVWSFYHVMLHGQDYLKYLE